MYEKILHIYSAFGMRDKSREIGKIKNKNFKIMTVSHEMKT